MDNNRTYILIGLARSGKSTFVQDWCKQCITNEIRVPIHADSIRLSLGHRYNSYVEGLVHEFKLLQLKSMLQIPNVWCIVDGTHSTKSSIQDILRIDMNAQPIVVPTDVEECVRRAKATNQADLEGPIRRMWENLQDLWNQYGRLDRAFSLEQAYWNEIVDKIRAETKPYKPCIVD
jgi:predicted kinase